MTDRPETVKKQATTVANRIINELEDYSNDAIIVGMGYVLALQLSTMGTTRGWDQLTTKKFAKGLFQRILRQMDKASEETNPDYTDEHTSIH